MVRNRANWADVSCPHPSAMFAGTDALARSSCGTSPGAARAETFRVIKCNLMVKSCANCHTTSCL